MSGNLSNSSQGRMPFEMRFGNVNQTSLLPLHSPFAIFARSREHGRSHPGAGKKHGYAHSGFD